MQGWHLHARHLTPCAVFVTQPKLWHDTFISIYGLLLSVNRKSTRRISVIDWAPPFIVSPKCIQEELRTWELISVMMWIRPPLFSPPPSPRLDSHISTYIAMFLFYYSNHFYFRRAATLDRTVDILVTGTVSALLEVFHEAINGSTIVPTPWRFATFTSTDAPLIHESQCWNWDWNVRWRHVAVNIWPTNDHHGDGVSTSFTRYMELLLSLCLESDHLASVHAPQNSNVASRAVENGRFLLHTACGTLRLISRY